MEDFIKIISGWYLDSLCLCAWSEFKNDKMDNFQRVIEILDSCVKNEITVSAHRRLQILFLNFLTSICYLNFGSSCDDDFNAQAIVILSLYNDILSECPHLNDAKPLDIDISREIIYSFCRNGHFDKAKKLYNCSTFQKVFKTLSTKIDTKSLVQEIETVLSSEDVNHPVLSENSYENFIKKIKPFLEETFQAIPQPFLYKLYKTFLDKMKVKSLCEVFDLNILEKINSETENELQKESCTAENEETFAGTSVESIISTPNASPAMTPTFIEELTSPSVLNSNKIKNIVSSETMISSESELPLQQEASKVNSSSDSNSQQEKMIHIFDYFSLFKGRISQRYLELLKSNNSNKEKEIDCDSVCKKIQERFKKMGILKHLQERAEHDKLPKEKSHTGKSERIITSRKSKHFKITDDQKLMRSENRTMTSPCPTCKVKCIPVEKDAKLSSEVRAFVRQELNRLSSGNQSSSRSEKRDADESVILKSKRIATIKNLVPNGNHIP